jgi:TolA-binding protein
MSAIVRFCFRGPTGVAVIALVGAFVPLAAGAQSPTVDRIDAIERQIRNMEGELRQLKRQLRESRSEAAKSRAELRQARQAAARATAAKAHAMAAAARAAAVIAAAPPARKAPPKDIQASRHRFGFESADGKDSIYLTGRLHFDVGDFRLPARQHRQEVL